ncbi:be4abeec-bc70-4908-8a89-bf9cdbf05d4a-CDS [Sclerotinia trifoliorum]|uniref:Be4abeec-bc70-4908-8a89-bf9cdbf05d4a-CDS n=1 Tax=Sclerotinia trifoliorum TaxID=28548 RepID=A0A8H2VUH1_9HELO|nr:be4abeec-bc70-4908-8a89-bf9cdbf05d4a-CDS [Sclerotinia trifoliorum]
MSREEKNMLLTLLLRGDLTVFRMLLHGHFFLIPTVHLFFPFSSSFVIFVILTSKEHRDDWLPMC